MHYYVVISHQEDISGLISDRATSAFVKHIVPLDHKFENFDQAFDPLSPNAFCSSKHLLLPRILAGDTNQVSLQFCHISCDCENLILLQIFPIWSLLQCEAGIKSGQLWGPWIASQSMPID
jgi:hypothetical protein